MDSTLIYILLAVALGVVQYAMGAEKRKKAKLRQQQLMQMQQSQQQEAQSETQGLPSWLAGLLDEAEKPSEGGFWDMMENSNEDVRENSEMDERVVEGMAAGLPEEGASAMPLVNLATVATTALPLSVSSFEEAPKEMEPALIEESIEPSCLDDFSIDKAILYSEVLKPRWKD